MAMQSFRRITLGLFCVLTFVLAGISSGSPGRLEVHFLDIGQGDSIYIRTPSGKDMLIDAGRSASVLRRLSEVMPWQDRSIDVLVETHPDADHIGGFPPILERYTIGAFIEPGIESSNAIDDEVHRILSEKGIVPIIARRGMSVDFRDGTVFSILFPDGDVSGLDDPNDASVIGRLVYGSTSVMLTGDAPKSSENLLVSLDGTRLKSDILKAGHHGSRTSSGEAFVRVVNPSYVIFSVGKDNTYHHPNEAVVELFKRFGVEALRTDGLGTIRFESDGRSFARK